MFCPDDVPASTNTRRQNDHFTLLKFFLSMIPPLINFYEYFFTLAISSSLQMNNYSRSTCRDKFPNLISHQ